MTEPKKRRSVKDCDAEIVALKRELIEARTRAVSLEGYVARLREEIEAAWDATGIKKNEREGSLFEAIEGEITDARRAGEEAAHKSRDEDDEEKEKARVQADAERENQVGALHEALEAAGVDWSRVWWKYGALCPGPIKPDWMR